MTTKERMKEMIEEQPDDASYDEIMRELAFARMVERGLADARAGRVISNEEMGKRIRLWQSPVPENTGGRHPGATVRALPNCLSRAQR